MFENKLIPYNRMLISTAISLVFSASILLFQIEDKWRNYFLLTIIGLTAIRPLPFKQWSKIDVSLALITIYDMVSCLHAACWKPAFYDITFSLFCLTSYLLLRKLFRKERVTQVIILGSCFPIGIALLLTICSFFIFRESVLSVGFQDTYHFRFLFRPLGYSINVWAEILLIILGWGCLLRRYSLLFTFLTVAAIMLSFSRGAYIALSIYLISWLTLINPLREKIRMVAVSTTAFLLIGLFFPNEMETTLRMNQTLSQKKSAEWRFSSTMSNLNAFMEHPYMGHGNGNYSYATDRFQNQDSTIPYTNVAPNVIILLLTEKGVIGLLLYLGLAITICHVIFKKKDSHEGKIILCTLLALFIKEMTQATLFGTPFALFMFYFLLAFLQKNNVRTKKIVAGSYVIPTIMYLCYMSWIFFVFQQNNSLSHQKESKEAWINGDFTKAVHILEQEKDTTPALINRSLLYLQHYQKTGDAETIQSVIQNLQHASHKHPKDVQILYLLARSYMAAKEDEKAFLIIKELATDYPKNSLYLCTLSDILYKQGERSAAMEALINAIRYTPRLLTSQRIKKLQQEDADFYKTLQRQFSILEPSPSDSPTDYARFGYIENWFGNTYLSEKYLKNAIAGLPSLATPWHLLGDDKKYRLLIYGAFSKDLASKRLPEEREMNDDLLLETLYRTKFEQWYQNELLLFTQ